MNFPIADILQPIGVALGISKFPGVAQIRDPFCRIFVASEPVTPFAFFGRKLIGWTRLREIPNADLSPVRRAGLHLDLVLTD